MNNAEITAEKARIAIAHVARRGVTKKTLANRAAVEAAAAAAKAARWAAFLAGGAL